MKLNCLGLNKSNLFGVIQGQFQLGRVKFTPPDNVASSPNLPCRQYIFFFFNCGRKRAENPNRQWENMQTQRSKTRLLSRFEPATLPTVRRMCRPVGHCAASDIAAANGTPVKFSACACRHVTTARNKIALSYYDVNEFNVKSTRCHANSK